MMVDVRVPCVCVFGLSVRHYLFLFIARVFTLLSVSCFTALHSSVAFVGRLRRQLPPPPLGERRTRSIWGVTTPRDARTCAARTPQLAQCARAGRRPARRHDHERALVAHHSSHTGCARTCRQTGSSHMGCARACTQTAAGTTSRGVISAQKRGNILRRATETVSHTFRVMSSSTRKLSTHDCTSSAVTNPAARILASSCSTTCSSDRSASANKSDQSVA